MKATLYTKLTGVIILFFVLFFSFALAYSIPGDNEANISPKTSYTILGSVNSLATSSEGIVSVNITPLDGNTNPPLNFDLANVKTVETKEYVALNLYDVQPGDVVILQGLLDQNGALSIDRLIDFTQTESTHTAPVVNASDGDVASSTATSSSATVLLDSATTTASEEIASSTTATTSESSVASTSSAEIIEATTTPEMIPAPEATQPAPPAPISEPTDSL